MTQSNDTFIYCKIDRKREYWKMSFRHNCQVIYRFSLRNEMRRTEEANAYLTFRSKTIHRQEVSSYIFITLRRVSYPYLTWHICSSIVLGHITRLNVYINYWAAKCISKRTNTRVIQIFFPLHVDESSGSCIKNRTV